MPKKKSFSDLYSFECVTCGFRSSWKANIKVHIKRYHTRKGGKENEAAAATTEPRIPAVVNDLAKVSPVPEEKLKNVSLQRLTNLTKPNPEDLLLWTRRRLASPLTPLAAELGSSTPAGGSTPTARPPLARVAMGINDSQRNMFWKGLERPSPPHNDQRSIVQAHSPRGPTGDQTAPAVKVVSVPGLVNLFIPVTPNAVHNSTTERSNQDKHRYPSDSNANVATELRKGNVASPQQAAPSERDVSVPRAAISALSSPNATRRSDSEDERDKYRKLPVIEKRQLDANGATGSRTASGSVVSPQQAAPSERDVSMPRAVISALSLPNATQRPDCPDTKDERYKYQKLQIPSKRWLDANGSQTASDNVESLQQVASSGRDESMPGAANSALSLPNATRRPDTKEERDKYRKIQIPKKRWLDANRSPAACSSSVSSQQAVPVSVPGAPTLALPSPNTKQKTRFQCGNQNT